MLKQTAIAIAHQSQTFSASPSNVTNPNMMQIRIPDCDPVQVAALLAWHVKMYRVSANMQFGSIIVL